MHVCVANEGSQEIGQMLRVNQNIRKLLLSSNLLGDAAIVHLAQALTVNTGLEMLLLADNPFGDEGGRHLQQVLCYNNRTLRVLDIHGTHMSKAGGKQVLACSYLSGSLRLQATVLSGTHARLFSWASSHHLYPCTLLVSVCMHVIVLLTKPLEDYCNCSKNA